MASERRSEFQPELWVDDGPEAVAFYERAFGAVVVHTVTGEHPQDIVAQLAVDGARFWVVTAGAELRRFSPLTLEGSTGRVLLVVEDPHALHARAVAAGARATSAVAPEHGWLVGRLVDPCGHEWEIGRPLGEA